MNGIKKDILTKLRGQKSPILAPDSDFILPYYEGLSIANLPANISKWLGVTPIHSKLLSSPLTESFK